MNICVISNIFHNAIIAIHGFLMNLIEYLKTWIWEIKLIYYFSDGAAAQYKKSSLLTYIYMKRTMTSFLNPGISIARLQLGKYVACMYDNIWWVDNECKVSCVLLFADDSAYGEELDDSAYGGEL